MEDITRIEGFVPKDYAETNSIELCYEEDRLPSDHAATLFISKDATPPKVWDANGMTSVLKNILRRLPMDCAYDAREAIWRFADDNKLDLET